MLKKTQDSLLPTTMMRKDMFSSKNDAANSNSGSQQVTQHQQHGLSLEDIEQDLVKKIVPVVVGMIKSTLAKQIFNSPVLTSRSNIQVI